MLFCKQTLSRGRAILIRFERTTFGVQGGTPDRRATTALQDLAPILRIGGLTFPAFVRTALSAARRTSALVAGMVAHVARACARASSRCTAAAWTTSVALVGAATVLGRVGPAHERTREDESEENPHSDHFPSLSSRIRS